MIKKRIRLKDKKTGEILEKGGRKEARIKFFELVKRATQPHKT